MDYVRRLARTKAYAIERGPDEVVLAADTVVVIGDEILEKPRDAADAARMLEQLSGREHHVITGYCLLKGAHLEEGTETTRVHFVRLTPEEIAEYVATGEPMDKAGAYAIQGKGARFIEGINGDYFNVMGLPVRLLYDLVRQSR